MAQVASRRGAEIMRYNPVLQISREGDHWVVETENSTLRADHIVNAAGTWGWEIGAMMGLNIPSVPVLHQYLVTDTIPRVADRISSGQKELPIIRDLEESWYVRQERDGLILGPYEKQATTWSVDGVPPDFGADLMPPDLDAVEHIIEAAMARIPALGEGGVKSVINGPITFTPDANPLIGPAHGIENGWLLTGSSMGVMEGGGAGKFLAHWMTPAEPRPWTRFLLTADGSEPGQTGITGLPRLWSVSAFSLASIIRLKSVRPHATSGFRHFMSACWKKALSWDRPMAGKGPTGLLIVRE